MKVCLNVAFSYDSEIWLAWLCLFHKFRCAYTTVAATVVGTRIRQQKGAAANPMQQRGRSSWGREQVMGKAAGGENRSFSTFANSLFGTAGTG